MALHVNSQMIIWNECVHCGSTFEPNLHCHSSKSVAKVHNLWNTYASFMRMSSRF